jgi:hypothetical protein
MTYKILQLISHAAVIFLVFGSASVANAESKPVTVDWRDTHSFQMGLGVGTIFVSTVNDCCAEITPILSLGKPLWLGNKYQYWQWKAAIEFNLKLGDFGVPAASTSALFGGILYLGSFYSLEILEGIGVINQFGPDNYELGLGIAGRGAHCFHFFADPRESLKIQIDFVMGSNVTHDAKSDTFSAFVYVVQLVYSSPL